MVCFLYIGGIALYCYNENGYCVPINILSVIPIQMGMLMISNVSLIEFEEVRHNEEGKKRAMVYGKYTRG